MSGWRRIVTGCVVCARTVRALRKSAVGNCLASGDPECQWTVRSWRQCQLARGPGCRTRSLRVGQGDPAAIIWPAVVREELGPEADDPLHFLLAGAIHWAQVEVDAVLDLLGVGNGVGCQLLWRSPERPPKT